MSSIVKEIDMKRLPYIMTLILALMLTACGSAARFNSANPRSTSQNGSTGELPATTQIALGTLKLDGTDNAVTAEQAAELLPLWETLRDLSTSDTAAQQEIQALDTQIQETMTDQQKRAITSMNLTRQDMFAVLQTQGTGFGNGQQSNNSQNGNSSGNGNRNFGSGGGFGPGAGGPPPDGGGFQGGAGFDEQGQTRSAEQIATAQAARQSGGGNRTPTPLINALIEFLKKRAGS
jgi:hypothetical protein